MNVLLNKNICVSEASYKEAILRMREMDRDERIAREALYEAWLTILEKYATPGTPIPHTDQVREELVKVGVKAAVDVLVAEHFWLYRWMIEGKLEEGVRDELHRFDLADFMEDVLIAQNNPTMFERLQWKLKNYVLDGLSNSWEPF